MDYARLIARYTERHRQHGWPRQRLLHECLRAAIRDGTLAAGTRLVATRALAEELGVARNTVLYAYEQLASEGYLRTDRRGTVVAAVAPERPPVVAAPAARAGLARRMRQLPVAPASAESGAFVPGVPALDQFPLSLWRRMLERAWRGLTVAQLNYADPAGEPALRAAIADHLRAARGVVCEAGQVFITDGTQSSLDLCARAFADEGDTVWHEHPGYAGALAAFRAAGLDVQGIPVDEEGMAPQAADWRERPPRLVYTTPSHQYPIGSVLSLRRRLALLAAARAAGALIIEDDYDSEFRHDGAPLSAMQGLEPDAPVLYLGTFSKTMFPSLRIGFVVVPPALAAALASVRGQASARGRVADQLALAEFLRSGQFSLHLRRMRRLYRQRRDALVAALETHMGKVATVHGGSAGMHLALRFMDPALSDTAISAQARAHGIVARPLSEHAVQGATGWHGLMLGYAQVPAERMDALVRQLAALVHLAAYAKREHDMNHEATSKAAP
ncbi:PLP-dependent aminotransferase family protein [Duganella sp. LX20W]|uniref:PLP-dependent aminotransferase family protein n=1 Tax=Rugamonas brunnea TaxID=2758569 RepID=A0A7W2ERI3_9BURK|nr:PLP-dependent aminotransferase family protein [Rugamonas brunnea]MBA5637314.1 PLP-dependent aminotransferase family protein [Rugamonas brunnea]